jgi:hypothetical protein
MNSSTSTTPVPSRNNDNAMSQLQTNLNLSRNTLRSAADAIVRAHTHAIVQCRTTTTLSGSRTSVNATSHTGSTSTAMDTTTDTTTTNTTTAIDDEGITALSSEDIIIAATRSCCRTLLKLLENVLHHTTTPTTTTTTTTTTTNHNDDDSSNMYHKVRRINLLNPKIQSSIVHYPPSLFARSVSKEGFPLSSSQQQQQQQLQQPGVQFLVACGFTQPSSHHTEQRTISIGDAATAQHTLQLVPLNEDRTHIQYAIQLLQQIVQYELPPPPVTTAVTASNATATSRATRPVPPKPLFNPYQGYRMDMTGQHPPTAATATTTNSTSTSTSTTITSSKIQLELQQLQAAQATIQQRVYPNTTKSTDPSMTSIRDRQWTMTILQPTNQTASMSSNTATSTDYMNASTTATTTTNTNRSDTSLLAQQLQKQTMAQQKRDNSGFTTRAMREIEALQKSRIYTHALLSIQVTMHNNLNQDTKMSGTTDASNHNNNTIIVQFNGTFYPQDTIDTVIQAIRNDCFQLPTTTTSRTIDMKNDHDLSTLDFELYSTPPMITYRTHQSNSNTMKKMKNTKTSNTAQQTLQEAQLVPASKLYVRWITIDTETNPTSDHPNVATVLQPKWWSIVQDSISNTTSTTSTATIAFPKSIPIVSALSSPPNTNSNDDDNTTNETKATTQPPKLTKEERMLRRMMGGT